MRVSNLSLVHRVQEPQGRDAGRSPLLLLLHGIGSNEDDLFSLASCLDERFLIVSARAPLVLGPASFAWFNIAFTPEGLIADLNQAEQSRQLLGQFIGELADTYPVDRERIYLMGFSQGAMMSLSLALTAPDKIRGVVAMSGRLPPATAQLKATPEALRGKPVFVAHGLYDPVIPIEYGRQCRAQLERLGVALDYREYAMAHEVSPASLRDISVWLAASLDEAAAAAAAADAAGRGDTAGSGQGE